ncbi:hypothetical protein Pint_20861 [Pistacia integerrima]|uniref:Uncharacterized protein n=1 Tax=Pistacia integerrima TaxID=434235 RepID=A0ACC0XBN1_9ROSI|nr:hypothetical protein Pint_20861 [Pistacia integerrima]
MFAGPLINSISSICLLSLSNLITTPRSPTLHVSYALSQLSLPLPLSFRSHAHFLVSPLLNALSSFDDQPIACPIIDVITTLCTSSDADIFANFFSHIANKLCSGAFAWSWRQLYMLHCFGVLLNSRTSNSYVLMKDRDALISNLVAGLQLPWSVTFSEAFFSSFVANSIYSTWNPTICFPVVGQVDMLPSSESTEKLNQMEEKKSKLGKLVCLKEKHTTALEKALKKFNKKKEKYKEHMFDISPKLRDCYLEYGNPEEE